MKKEDLPEYKKFSHLMGVGIGMAEASRKYGIAISTIHRWVNLGYIEIMGRDGRKVIISEQSVAYCAEIYRQRGGQGRWLFNDDGTPYQPVD